MNKETYLEKLKIIFKENNNSIKLFSKQIDNYYNAKNNYKQPNHNYKIGDLVKLKKHQLLRGEGALTKLNEDKLKFISENGFISPDFLNDINLNKKTPLTIPVWNIQKEILLKDYIINYSGATLKYISRDGLITTKLIPYKKIDEEIEKIRNENFWTWQCEQTKEIRFMPSLARDNIQLGFIMNIENDYGKSILENDIFNLSFDKEILQSFIQEYFIKDFIYAKRNDFTTNRESAIIFGIPSCFIEGLLVGRKYEQDEKKLNLLKNLFPNCYICNLDGKVIKK